MRKQTNPCRSKHQCTSPNKWPALRVLACGCAAALTLAVGNPVRARAQHSDDYYRGMAQGLELFGEVYREIMERYAGEVDPGRLAEQAIGGMMASLDRYSAYVSPETGQSTSRRNLRVGVGIEADTVEGRLTVTEVLEDHAAHSAGVRVGDIILAVDDNDLPDNSPETLYGALRGEIGSAIHLTIAREGIARETTKTFTLTRERIRIPNIRYSGLLQDSILFLRLERFGENAGNEFRSELLRTLQDAPFSKNSGKIGGIILDLRGNTGGILEEAVRIAETFVPRGELIVATEGRDSAEHEVWRSDREPIAAGIPLILLTDRKTASASELLAAAIQDHDLGLIVGEPTVGKGVVQSVRTLPFGASMRLTTAWYVTPSGRSIQRVDGLVPGNISSGANIIPDSLLQEFRTANGRTVESGAGIVPDTSLSAIAVKPIVRRLEQIEAFFRFASLYTAQLDSLPANFRLGNGDLLSFEEHALGQLLQYEEEQGTIAALDSLQETLAGRKGEKRIARLFDDLSRAIIADDETAFADAREEIRRRLEYEIVGRFRSRRQQIEAGLANDPQVRLATALLQNRAAYKRLLGFE